MCSVYTSCARLDRTGVLVFDLASSKFLLEVKVLASSTRIWLGLDILFFSGFGRFPTLHTCYVVLTGKCHVTSSYVM